MKSLRQKRKSIAILVVVAVSIFSVISAPAHAAMVNTAEILKQTQINPGKDRIHLFIDRSEVRNQLVDWGVSVEEAKAMVDRLSNREIDELAARIDQLPAGGSDIGVVLGTLLVIFLVLLVTDIMGYTEIFPFVKRN